MRQTAAWRGGNGGSECDSDDGGGDFNGGSRGINGRRGRGVKKSVYSTCRILQNVCRYLSLYITTKAWYDTYHIILRS